MHNGGRRGHDDDRRTGNGTDGYQHRLGKGDTMDTSLEGVLFDDAGRVLLGLNPREEWELLGGRADPDDADPAATIRREFLEEAALAVEVEDLIDIWYYDVAGAGRVAVASYLVHVEPAALHTAALHLSDEHADLRFVPPDELESLPIPDGYTRTIRKAQRIGGTPHAAG
jgi:8-oxo-dGTP pyrophosphatase MutT (NUDIX family)